MRLILIRGLPGSGKTTLAKYLAEKLHALHFEADHFFEDAQTGEYRFNPKLLKAAHLSCLKNTEAALVEHRSVVVANTFTTRSEMQPYFELADKFGLNANVIECAGDYGSVHNVPEHVIERMKARWEN